MTKDEIISPTPIKRLFDRIGNPLEWSYVNKILYFQGFQIVVYVSFIFYSYLTIRYPVLFPQYVDRSKLTIFLRINITFVLLCSVLFVYSLWLRKANPNNHWIAYFTAILLTVQNIIFYCALGHATNPQILMVLFLLFFVGLLIFDLTFFICVGVSWLVVHGFHIFAEQVGIIPYAWILNRSPFENGSIDTAWMLWNFGVGLMTLSAMLIILGYILNRWRTRETQVRELSELLKKMFGRYLSTEVMSSLIENPSLLELGGERKYVTIMMTDLRGFTALSERLQPEQVVQMLNSYFEIMVETVLKYNGTINEIIGDALLVIFGAPQDMPDQAERAIACSIEMQNAMGKVNKENRFNGLPDLEMGIGINKTEVIVGNIGSSKRSKYTVVGSGVNMTSRIESYTVGGQILISESVFKEIANKLRIDGEQEVYPKGSETPFRIYEVGGIADKYNLELDVEDTAMLKLLKQIPFKYSLIGGKHIRQENLKGHIVKLSKKSAEVELDVSAGLLTNLKMNLINVGNELSTKDIYGKVIDPSGQDNYLIRFTSVPPEISAFFHAYRNHVS